MISYKDIETQTGWHPGVTVKRRYLYICSAFMVGMMIANVVRAESPAQAPAGASDGASDALQEVVVSARRRDENLQSVPVAVTAFNAEALTEHNVTSVENLGAITPSLSFSRSTYGLLGTSVAIRGQRPNDLDLSQTPSVGIYVDDVYLSSTMGLSAISLADAQSVEVLKGPQGTLYGRNTTGGAIKISTGLPDLQQATGLVRAGGGNESDARAYASFSVPLINDHLAFSVNGSYDKNDGYGRDTLSNTYIGNTDIKSINAALRFQPDESFQAILRAGYLRASSGGLLTTLTAIVPGGGLNTIAAYQLGYGLTPAGFAQALSYLNSHYVDQQGFDRQYNGPLSQNVFQTTTSLTLEYDVSPSLALKSISAFQRVSDFLVGDNDGTLFRTVDGDFENMSTYQITEELQASGSLLNDQLKYTGGYYFYRLPGDESAHADVLFPLVGETIFNNNHMLDRSHSGYGQATYTVVPRVRLTGGIRFTDEINALTTRNQVIVPGAVNCNVPPSESIDGECEAKFYTHGSNWSYTGSVDYDVSDSVLAYLKTSRGYKAGGINQRGNVGGGYTPFQPEQVTDYEIGMKSELWDHRIRLNAAGYFSKYENIQRTVLVAGIGGGPETAVLNAANANIKGLELELTVRPTSNLTLSATGSFIDAGYSRYIDPLTLADYSEHVFPGVPRWLGDLSAQYEYTIPVGTLKTSLDYSYQSKVNYSPDNNLPPSATFPEGTAPYTSQGAYGLLNGRMSLDIAHTKWQVALWARNLANKYYYDGGDDFATTVGYSTLFVGRPRTYGGEVAYRF